MDTVTANGLTFVLTEVHQRAPRSWNRNRKNARFDGWDLKLPGTFHWSRHSTREEAVAAAQKLSAAFGPDLERAQESNSAALAKTSE